MKDLKWLNDENVDVPSKILKLKNEFMTTEFHQCKLDEMDQVGEF